MRRHETIVVEMEGSRRTCHGQGGFALPVTLIFMMVIGAMLAGGFYASSQDSEISASTAVAGDAFQVAEYGLEEALGSWTNADLLYETWDPDGAVTTGSGAVVGTYQRSVVPLGGDRFLIAAHGRTARGFRRADRRLGVLVETINGALPYTSALTVYGAMSVKGNSTIDGTDEPGGGSLCGPGSGMVPGVTVATPGAVTASGSAEIIGDPPEQVVPGMTRESLRHFGPIALQDLISSATITLSPGATVTGAGPVTRLDGSGATVCDRSGTSNWGDPTGAGPCRDHMPIIHVPGSLKVSGGTGQGILVVDGDLDASGGFSFYGVTIVTGTLKTTGTGAHFNGTVIVQGDGELDSQSTQAGNSVVQYSQCRVQRAFDAALRIRPLDHRSWIDLSGVAPAST